MGEEAGSTASDFGWDTSDSVGRHTAAIVSQARLARLWTSWFARMSSLAIFQAKGANQVADKNAINGHPGEVRIFNG